MAAPRVAGGGSARDPGRLWRRPSRVTAGWPRREDVRRRTLRAGGKEPGDLPGGTGKTFSGPGVVRNRPAASGIGRDTFAGAGGVADRPGGALWGGIVTGVGE